jgi:SAM-dependent methyltransferase
MSGSLYADLSAYYDRFCAEVDYAEQCEFAQRVFDGFASSGGRDYLDLACGTGQHLRHMQQRGFTASGLDNSAQMLELAQQRCPDAQLLLCDLAAFDQRSAYDLITCFLYSIHYSHPLSSLTQTLQRAWRALKPGGVFIFNAVDAAGIHNDNKTITQLTDGDSTFTFQSAWHYCGTGEVLDLVLTIRRESTAGIQRWSDQHTMTATSLLQLRTLLEEVGFEVTVLEHDYSLMRMQTARSFNAILIACKPAV